MDGRISVSYSGCVDHSREIYFAINYLMHTLTRLNLSKSQ